MKMIFYFKILILTVFGFLPLLAYSHPVIYKNGWVYWGEFFGTNNRQRLSYTFHPKASIELQHQTYNKNFTKWSGAAKVHSMPEKHRETLLGFNILAKRWLFQHSQANIYAGLAGRYNFFYSHENTDATQTLKQADWLLQPSVSADWESRKLYTALSLKARISEEKSIIYNTRWRAGFAPYMAGMEQLQAWMVFQLDYSFASSTTPPSSKNSPSKNKPWISPMPSDLEFTALMRFFYKNTLWEIGSSLEGRFFLTLMIHH